MYYHWTTLDKLIEMYHDDALFGSLTDNPDLPFDQDNGCHIALMIDPDDAHLAGYQKLQPGDDGCTALEFKHELRSDEPITLSLSLRGFAVRDTDIGRAALKFANTLFPELENEVLEKSGTYVRFEMGMKDRDEHWIPKDDPKQYSDVIIWAKDKSSPLIDK